MISLSKEQSLGVRSNSVSEISFEGFSFLCNMSTNYHYVMSPFSNVSGKAILLHILAIDST